MRVNPSVVALSRLEYGVLVTTESTKHPGGGFNPPEPTTKGGPDYGRFIDAVRKLQDHARAADAPDEVITEAATCSTNYPRCSAGFNPPEPTTKGGPDYGRFIDAVRKLQDHARAVDAPDEVITEAADTLEKLSALLSPYNADEWESPSGRRMDLPVRGNILTVPISSRKTDDGRIQGTARFARFHLGRNGAVHGGSLGMLFDTVLGMTGSVLTGNPRQRTAYLTINYRNIVPIEKDLQFDAGVDRVDGRKVFVSGRLTDGDTLLSDADALFVRLKPGQP